MTEAGITSGESLHPQHLWPQTRDGRIIRISTKQAVARFKRGMRFYGARNEVVKLHDLPEGTNVILHANQTARVRLKVTIN